MSFREQEPAATGAWLYWSWVGLCLVIGLALRWPMLDAGAGSDDFVQEAILDGVFASPRGPLDLFNFASGDRADNRILKNFGTLPWWSHPELNLSMYRPASSALAILDRALFPTDLYARHLLSFVVWAMLAMAVAALFRRLLPLGVASVALLLFVLDEAYNLPMGWLAHRGALCALLFGVLGMHAHMSKGKWRHGPTLLLLSIALSFGEWAAPFLGYFLAYQGLVARGSLKSRVLGLWPVLVPVAGYGWARVHSGRGVAHSGIYVEMLHEPLRYFMLLPERGPALMADLVLSISAECFHFGTPWQHVWEQSIFGPWSRAAQMPPWKTWHIMLGVLALIWVVVVLRWALHVLPSERRGVLLFFAVGGALSMIPAQGAFVTSRLLMPAVIGYSALVATVVCAAWERVRQGAFLQHLGLKALLFSVFYFGVVETTLSDVEEVSFLSRLYPAVRTWFAKAPLDDEQLPNQHVFLLNTQEHTTQVFGPYVLHHVGRPMPRSFWTLSGAAGSHSVTRVSDRKLRITLLGVPAERGALERLYRDSESPLHAGDSVRLPTAAVNVIQTAHQRPVTFEIELPRSVDDPSYVFLFAAPGGLRRFVPPKLGRTLSFSPAAFPVMR